MSARIIAKRKTNQERLTEIERELLWYLNSSDAAMGYSSNYYAMINTSTHSPASAPEPLINFLKPIRRHRKVHQIFLSLSRSQRRFIQALYDDEYQTAYGRLAKSIKNVFDHKTGLLFCLTDINEFERLLKICSKKLKNTTTEIDEAYLAKLREMTDQEYDKLYAFLEALFRKAQ